MLATNVHGRSSDAARGAVLAPKIREASFEDYERISALQAAHQRPAKKYEEWVHLWINNPAYRPYRDAMPIGWVLELPDKRIVGYLGNIPLLYELEGHRLLASAAHAWVVDVQYRPYSLALLDLYFSQKSVDLFLNATVGPAGFDSFNVFNSHRVPSGIWDHSAFWITDRRGFMAAWLEDKAVPFKKSLSRGLAGALAARQVFSTPILSEGDLRGTLNTCKNIDERFDVFWESLRARSPRLLRGVRNREVLEWHFHYPMSSDRVWILTNGTDPILAYAIFLRYDNPRASLTRMRLVDYQSLDGKTTLLAPMLRWALERCRREGIHMLEAIGLRADKWERLSELKPYERKLPCWLYFYKARDKKLAQELSDPDLWDASQFDGDASL